MDTNGTGNDGSAADDQAECGLATSRSRRERNVRSRGRKSALEAFKNNRKSGRTRDEDDDQIDNVYDMVDENQYSEMVAKRINDDWLVGEELEDEYYEDGRELFDEDVNETKDKKGSAAAKKAKAKKASATDSKVNNRWDRHCQITLI